MNNNNVKVEYVEYPYGYEEPTWFDWLVWGLKKIVKLAIIVASIWLLVDSYMRGCFDGLGLLGAAGLVATLILCPLAKRDAR